MFSEKLKELRESKKISQYELAEIIHVSRTVVSKWERGAGLPSNVNLESLCSYFNVSEEELIGYIEYKKAFNLKKENNNVVILSLSCLFIIIFMFIFSITPIYFYNHNWWDSFSIDPESILSSLGYWSIIPITIYFTTIITFVLILFDFLKVNFENRKKIIVFSLIGSIVIFILTFIVSLLLLLNINYRLFY